MTAERMPRVALDEVVDVGGLERLERTIRADADGMAEFGGFYGAAVRRLGPLLGTDRRAWIVVVDGGDAGFLDADLDDGWVGLSWFVAERVRRKGVARTAVGRLLGIAPWPAAAGYLVAVDPDNVASSELARSTGFAVDAPNHHGELVWRRELPCRRAGMDDPRRFLDRGGRLERWPTHPADRERMVSWLATEVLPDDTEVVDERELGIRLSRTVDDVALARRLLVDHGLVERTRTGSEYARVSRSD